jgi:hypothetical protein
MSTSKCPSLIHEQIREEPYSPTLVKKIIYACSMLNPNKKKTASLKQLQAMGAWPYIQWVGPSSHPMETEEIKNSKRQINC